MIQADAQELLAVARETLLAEVLPQVSGDTTYQVRMIANAMAIAAREIREASRYVEDERAALASLLGTNGAGDVVEQSKRLCEWIDQGYFDHAEEEQRLIAGLRSITMAKLRISNPKLLKQD